MPATFGESLGADTRLHGRPIRRMPELLVVLVLVESLKGGGRYRDKALRATVPWKIAPPSLGDVPEAQALGCLDKGRPP